MIFALVYFAIASAYLEAVHWHRIGDSATRRELAIVIGYLALSFAYLTTSHESPNHPVELPAALTAAETRVTGPPSSEWIGFHERKNTAGSILWLAI
jgi:hypothetical protein